MGTEKMVVVVEVETAYTPVCITAKEARAMADQKLHADGQRIFKTIIEQIPEYAKQGNLRHDFRIDGRFAPYSEQTAVVLLEQLGYRVKIVHTTTPNLTWYEVQW